MTLLLSNNDDGNNYLDNDDFDCGGLVAPKSDCPHIASHVKLRVVHGELGIIHDNDDNNDDSTNNNNNNNTNNNNNVNKYDGETEQGMMRQTLQRLHLETTTTTPAEAIITASCQHFQCANRCNPLRKNKYNNSNKNKVDEMVESCNDDDAVAIDTKDDGVDEEEKGNEEEKEVEEEEEEEVYATVVGENWLCLECGLVHCSRYQFGHAKLHYETTKEQQQQQQQLKQRRGHEELDTVVTNEGNDGTPSKEGGNKKEYSLLPLQPPSVVGVEGHCIAVSMADLSVWCYECNSYLRHPILYELTKHLEGLKFGCTTSRGGGGGGGGRENDPVIHGIVAKGGEDGAKIKNVQANQMEEEVEEEEEEEEEDNDNDEVVIKNEDGEEEITDENEDLEVQDDDHGDAKSDSLENVATSSNEQPVLSSSSNSIHKRKGQPPKRSAPNSPRHDWSYQKFKPDDGGGHHGRSTSYDRSNNTDECVADDSSYEREEEDEALAALIESQHGGILRAYLARHESFDTSNMGQCVPMHPPTPPSFPDEMADFLRSPLCKSIIVLAGAGMSVSCGIPDFRSVGVGLYDTLRPELLTASAEERALIESDPTLALHKHLFLQNPLPMLETKRSFILGTHEKKWKATLAHRFVELLHTKLGKLTRLYTQNIDGLELQTAIPEKKVVNVHGSMGAAACELCGHGMDFDEFCGKVRSNIKDITGEDVDAPTNSTPIYCNACGEPTVKPDIVLFASNLPGKFYKRTAKDLPEADLLIVMGTSLSVAPANSLVYRIPSTALRLIMNNEPVGRRLGIDYSDSAIRDVWAHGSTDESCLNLAEKMGWLDDLASILDELPDSSARLLRNRLARRKVEEEDEEGCSD